MQNNAESLLLHDDLSKGERTRAALVAAAIRRFAQDGFQRTSVADVARDVGMTAGAPYRYFHDKEALFLAAVDADGAELIDLVRTTVFSQVGVGIREQLSRLTDQLAQGLDRHPLVARVLGGGEPMGPERLMALPNLASLRGELTALIAAGQKAGIIRDSTSAAVLALGIETAVLYQLAHIASLRGSGALPDRQRWAALATLVEAALDPDPLGHEPSAGIPLQAAVAPPHAAPEHAPPQSRTPETPKEAP